MSATCASAAAPGFRATASRPRWYWPPRAVEGRVTRCECPNLPALTFTCEGALQGGVTVSPGLDPHGKSLSFALLEMRVEFA